MLKNNLHNWGQYSHLMTEGDEQSDSVSHVFAIDWHVNYN